MRRHIRLLAAYADWKLMLILELKRSSSKYNYSSVIFNNWTKQQIITSYHRKKIIMKMAVENKSILVAGKYCKHIMQSLKY